MVCTPDVLEQDVLFLLQTHSKKPLHIKNILQLLTYFVICYMLDNFLNEVDLNVRLWDTMSLNNTIVF